MTVVTGPRGMFSQNALEMWLREHLNVLSTLRNRRIDSLTQSDEAAVLELFQSLRAATKVAVGRRIGDTSSVSVSKALHVLLPDFLPAWDEKIAEGYGCGYGGNPSKAYLRFCYLIRYKAETLASKLPASNKPLLKRIDEYNFVTFTLPRLREERGKAARIKKSKQQRGASTQGRPPASPH